MDLDAVGSTVQSAPFSWSDRDVLLYALGVGASQDDQFSELQFTTENSTDLPVRVLPTFTALVAQQASERPPIGDVPPGMTLHAGEAFVQAGALPLEATVVAVSTVTGIFDKGSGALVSTDTDLVEVATRKVLATTTSSVFVRGEGGFGGERGPSGGIAVPERPPDHSVSYATRPDQALLYRLMGDRNPLHSDPVLARLRGTHKPILHGLCTYGFTGRALLRALCEGDPDRMRSMSGRFTSPVTPGDKLTVDIWVDGDEATYRTSTGEGAVALLGTCDFSDT